MSFAERIDTTNLEVFNTKAAEYLSAVETLVTDERLVDELCQGMVCNSGWDGEDRVQLVHDLSDQEGLFSVGWRHETEADKSALEHGVRVARLSVMMADALRIVNHPEVPQYEYYGLFLEHLKIAAEVHDLGKTIGEAQVAYQRSLLPGVTLPLEVIQLLRVGHVQAGYDLAKRKGLSRFVLEVIAFHHMWPKMDETDLSNYAAQDNGSLTVTEVPFAAQIVAYADNLDVMTGREPKRLGYVPIQSYSSIYNSIASEKFMGKKFDESLLPAFQIVLTQEIAESIVRPPSFDEEEIRFRLEMKFRRNPNIARKLLGRNEGDISSQDIDTLIDAEAAYIHDFTKSDIYVQDAISLMNHPVFSLNSYAVNILSHAVEQYRIHSMSA